MAAGLSPVSSPGSATYATELCPISRSRRRRKQRRGPNRTEASTLGDRLRLAKLGDSGGEFAAYFQLQTQYKNSHTDFVEQSGVIRGSTQVLKAVDSGYCENSITTVNVRAFHRAALAQLNAALSQDYMEDIETTCDALESARILFSRIVDEQPTFLRARIGLRKCADKLEHLQHARLHARKQAAMHKLHGANFEDVSLCEMDGSEESVRQVFNFLDADQSGTLELEEVKLLIHYFEETPPTDTAVVAAMDHMDRDGSGKVELAEFLWWWNERMAGEETVNAASRIQAFARGAAARRQTANDQLQIIALQSKVRRKLGRARFVRQRRRMLDAQAQRDFEEMRRLREEEDMQQAATKIQCSFRGRHSRQLTAQQREERYFREMEAASLKIQSSFRGLKGRKAGETQRDYQKRVSLDRLYCALVMNLPYDISLP